MTEINMPRLSDSMEQGTVLTWLVADGEPVQAGQDLVEIETDKATVTHPAEASGVLSIAVPEGGTVAVGAVIARVGGDSAATAAAAPVEVVAAESQEHVARANGASTRATPLARRVAAAHGVTIDGLAGTGPRGRVTREDVLRAAGVSDGAPTWSPARTPAAAPASPEGISVREPSRLQLLIARRMAEAKATIPHFQVQTEVAIDAALALRGELKRVADPPPSLNDMIVKAAALALRDHPLANASFSDERFVLHEHVNVGIAVAAQDALIVPAVRDADLKPLGQIARETRALAERVRDGSVALVELEGATFTVSNLGMFGMTAITPVVNPPQAAILGVGAVRSTLARGQDGEIVDRGLLTLTLSCDHRILYGADAARFLADVQALLESPLRVLI